MAPRRLRRTRPPHSRFPGALVRSRRLAWCSWRPWVRCSSWGSWTTAMTGPRFLRSRGARRGRGDPHGPRGGRTPPSSRSWTALERAAVAGRARGPTVGVGPSHPLDRVGPARRGRTVIGRRPSVHPTLLLIDPARLAGAAGDRAAAQRANCRWLRVFEVIDRRHAEPIVPVRCGRRTGRDPEDTRRQSCAVARAALSRSGSSNAAWRRHASADERGPTGRKGSAASGVPILATSSLFSSDARHLAPQMARRPVGHGPSVN